MPKVVHSHLFFWCCLGSMDVWSLTGELSIALHPYTGSIIISNLSERAPSHFLSLPPVFFLSLCLRFVPSPHSLLSMYSYSPPPTRLF